MAEPKSTDDTIWAEESRGDDRLLPAGGDTIWERESRGDDRIVPAGEDTIWERESRGEDTLPETLLVPAEQGILPGGCYPDWELSEDEPELEPDFEFEPIELEPEIEFENPPAYMPEGDVLF